MASREFPWTERLLPPVVESTPAALRPSPLDEGVATPSSVAEEMDGERLLESDCSMVTIVVCECVSAKRKPEKCSGNAQGVWREGGWGEAELLHTILPVSQHDCLRSSMAKDKKGLIRVQWISALKAGGDCRVASDSTMTPDKCT